MKKAEIRRAYLNKRKEISKEDIKLASMNISAVFFREIDLSEVKILHIFIPIKKFNEVDTWLIIHKIWSKYPSIQTATSITENDKLRHVLFNKSTIFIDDNWGIPTPQNGQIVNVNEIDLVVTPLLAFDSNLQRVGYRKGCYDKFLSECKLQVKKVGVSLFPVLENLIENTNPHDIPLDEIITPRTKWDLKS